MHPAPPPKPIRNAPLALWRVAEAFLHTLHALFGAPEDVAFRHTLTRGPYRLMCSWVRCAEALLRRLLLIEAAALPKPNTRPILWAKRQRARRTMTFSPDKPEEWRVSFRIFSSPVHGGSVSARSAMTMGAGASAPSVACGDTSPACGGGNKFHSAWPLAERYEALIRIFNDPVAAARRLAKRLYARAVAVCALLRAPREAQHRIDRFDEFEAHSDAAADHFLNSS